MNRIPLIGFVPSVARLESLGRHEFKVGHRFSKGCADFFQRAVVPDDRSTIRRLPNDQDPRKALLGRP